MAYKLTLTQDERKAIDWVGYRAQCGDELYKLLWRDCEIENAETAEQWEEKANADTKNCMPYVGIWSDYPNDITFIVPENIAWSICEMREELDGAWYCFASEFCRKLDEFCDRVV